MSNVAPDALLSNAVEQLRAEVQAIRRSRRRLVLAADADRRAIEGALHDGVQQDLVALAVNLRHVAKLVDGDTAAAKTLLDELAVAVRAALDRTRQLAQSIFPPLLEARGLARELRSAAEAAGVSASVTTPADTSYPVEIAVAVYWCWVDILSSARAGTQATVTVAEVDGTLTFEFAVAGPYPDERLERVRDRIEALGGRVTAGDGNGSRVAGWLPLSD